MDEDANFCFQVDFSTLLVLLEEILDVDPNSKWSGLLCFLHHNVKDFKQDGAVQIQDDRVIATDGVIMRNKHKSLVHLYCYRCIDDKEQGNNDEENVAKVIDLATSFAKVADVDQNLGNESTAVKGFKEAIEYLGKLKLSSDF